MPKKKPVSSKKPNKSKGSLSSSKSSSSFATKKKSKSKKKPLTKTIHPKKKIKPVIVDVIEDEPLDADLAWLADNDKLKIKNPKTKEAFSGKENNSNVSEIKELSSIKHKANEELDSQKEFFQNLAKEIKTKDKSKRETADNYKKYRSLRLYRRLVIKFLILVAIVAALVVYFSFSKLTVSLNLKGETINDNLLLKVVDTNFKADNPDLNIISSKVTNNLTAENDPRQTIPGIIKEISTTVIKNYPANGEVFLGNEIKGRVTIINNYNRNQPLVATTRLLSPDNKLFRIKNGVNVPAGGEVSVDIYTNKANPSMAIGPTTFTIPGLWAGLQDKIYAKNEASFTYVQKIKKYVNSSDLAYAAQNINRILINQAKAKAQSISPKTKWLYIINNPATITINAKAGDRQAEFSAKAVGKIIAVSFSRSEVAKLAEAKLKLSIPENRELINFNPTHIIYTLMSYDPVTHFATVKATFTGTMILKKNSAIISPKSLVNLTAKQINTYLKAQPEISAYTLKFYPRFIKRAPSLADRIKIKINKN